MKKYSTFGILLSVLFFFPVASSPVFASTSCPLYDARNVKVNLSTVDRLSSSGSSLSFTANVQNDNSFPITDASLLVYIVGLDGRMHDRFFVDTGTMILPAKSVVPITFLWKAPAFSTPGTYIARTYVYSSRQFYVGGVPFIDSLSAGETVFSLVGDNRSFVALDPSSLVVNSQIYSPKRGFVISATEPGSLSIKIDHNLKQTTEALVVWKIYARDSALEKNLVESSVEKISLIPGLAATSKLTMRDTSVAEYEIIGEIKWMDAKSVISTRVYRGDKSESRFSLLAFSPFTSTNTPGQVFGCIDNKTVRGDEDNFPKSLTISMRDENGREISQKSFNIERSPIAGFAEILPRGSFSKLNIIATLSDRGGKEEISTRIVYDCSLVGGDSCSAGSARQSFPYLAVVALFGGFVLAFFTWKFHKKSLQANSLKIQ